MCLLLLLPLLAPIIERRGQVSAVRGCTAGIFGREGQRVLIVKRAGKCVSISERITKTRLATVLAGDGEEENEAEG